MSVDTVRSAYPRSVEELLPLAQGWADELGDIPTRNQLMQRFRIGAPKAKEINEALIQDQAARMLDAGPDPDDDELVDPWEHAVPVESVPDTRVSEPDPDAVAPAAEGTVVTPVPAVVEPDRVAAAVVGGPADTRVSEVPDAPLEAVPGPSGSVEARDGFRSQTGTDTRVSGEGLSVPETLTKPVRPAVVWPIILLTLPAFVAVWGGWVELGRMTGFGPVDLLPGFTKDGAPLVTFNTAITLPIGMETYAAYALYVALSGRVPARARAFARVSAIASLAVGAAGQVAYHLLKAGHQEAVAQGPISAPWPITMAVSCLPVVVLGMGAALAHMVREGR